MAYGIIFPVKKKQMADTTINPGGKEIDKNLPNEALKIIQKSKGKRFLLILFLFSILTGCSVLTKSQIDSIHVYSLATQEYSQYPAQLIKDFVEVQNNIFLLTSPLIFNPERAADRIFSHQMDQSEILEEAERLDLSFTILKEYAKNLEILSTPGYFEKFNTNIKNTGTNLDLLVDRYNTQFDKKLPEGVGSLVYRSLVLVGKESIARQRGNILKNYILKGDPIIKEITEVTKEFLEGKVSEVWLKQIDLELKSAHTAVRRQIVVDTLNYPSSAFHIIQLDTRVDQLYKNIYQLKKLNESLLISLDELYPAHHAITIDVRQKKKLTTILTEITLFVAEVHDIIEQFKIVSKE